MAEVFKNIDQTICSTVGMEGECLTFIVDKEEYWIEILKIMEITDMMPITPVPRKPEYIKGVIDLLGKVIPVMDLRRRFGINPIDDNEGVCIIVVEIEGQRDLVMNGILVDRVCEVVNIKREDIESTSTFDTRPPTDCIIGVPVVDEGIKILLDIDKVISAKEVKDIC